jgi:hypothetical protein
MMHHGVRYLVKDWVSGMSARNIIKDTYYNGAMLDGFVYYDFARYEFLK